MIKLRSVKQAVLEIKQNDPNSAFSEHFLRNLIRENKSISINSGKRIFVNMDLLYELLNNREV